VQETERGTKVKDFGRSDRISLTAQTMRPACLSHAYLEILLCPSDVIFSYGCSGQEQYLLGITVKSLSGSMHMRCENCTRLFKERLDVRSCSGVGNEDCSCYLQRFGEPVVLSTLHFIFHHICPDNCSGQRVHAKRWQDAK
jgi:hypothetical protein